MGDEDTEKLREEGFFFHIDFDPFKLQLLWSLFSPTSMMRLDWTREASLGQSLRGLSGTFSGLRQGAHDLYLIEP